MSDTESDSTISSGPAPTSLKISKDIDRSMSRLALEVTTETIPHKIHLTSPISHP